MPPSQFVQKPFKVNAEQFTGTLPPDSATRAGLCICTTYPTFADGSPHVHGATTCYAVAPTDWICQQQWSPHDWFVIPDAEFQDRF
jgi:hypothetical protein